MPSDDTTLLVVMIFPSSPGFSTEKCCISQMSFVQVLSSCSSLKYMRLMFVQLVDKVRHPQVEYNTCTYVYAYVFLSWRECTYILYICHCMYIRVCILYIGHRTYIRMYNMYICTYVVMCAGGNSC